MARNLNVKLFVDNNNVTIAGKPSEYLKGYEVGRTLSGHGLHVVRAKGEDLDSLYPQVCEVLTHKGPAALIVDRTMAPHIEGVEGTVKAHDVVPIDIARKYLATRGYTEQQLAFYDDIKPGSNSWKYQGSSKDKVSNRVIFGGSSQHGP